MKTYIGAKLIKAKPMTKGEYAELRHFLTPSDGEKEGYLVEYSDGESNDVSGHSGYVSWSPKEVFEKCYRLID